MQHPKLWAVLGALLAVLYMVFVALVRDSQPPDDADLRGRVVWSSVDEADNAFAPLVRAQRSVQYQESSFYDFDARALVERQRWDRRAAEAFLEKNRETLVHLDDALGRKVVRAGPRRSEIICEPRLADLLMVRSWAALDDGRISAAFEDALDVYRLAKLYETSDSDLSVVALSLPVFRGRAVEHMAKLIEASELDPELAKAVMDHLGNMNVDGQILADKLLASYEQSLREIDAGRPSAIFPSYEYQRNKTKTLAASAYRQGLKNLRNGCAGTRVSPPWRGEWDPFLPNARGRASLDYLESASVMGQQPWRKCLANDEIDALPAVLALKSYRFENGGLPQTLQALVPRYLNEIPRSRIDGKPFQYSQTQEWLEVADTRFELRTRPAESDSSVAH